VFATIGVDNPEQARELAEKNDASPPGDLIDACRAMQIAVRGPGMLEHFPGAVHRAIDVLRPRHEARFRAKEQRQ
jgi:hypothetical protein